MSVPITRVAQPHCGAHSSEFWAMYNDVCGELEAGWDEACVTHRALAKALSDDDITHTLRLLHSRFPLLRHTVPWILSALLQTGGASV